MRQVILHSSNSTGFGVSLTSEGFTGEEILKLSCAINHLADALSSHQFEQFCNAFYYNETLVTGGKLWWKKTETIKREFFRFNNGLSRNEIYGKLMEGSETLQPGADHEADIHLIIDRRSKRSVLGYTYANTTKQWVYNYFFQNGTIEDVAGNLGHEWCHKMGFGHEFNFTTHRDKTVPYAVGYFVKNFRKDLSWEEIYSKMYS